MNCAYRHIGCNSIHGAKREFTAKPIHDASASIHQFANTMDGKSDGEHFAVYTEISERGREVLENVMKTQLEGACDSASLLDATLTVKIDERKYDSATLEAEFGVEIRGKTYPVSMCVELDFDYGESFDIYLPDDVDQYVENEFDNFIG